MGKDIQTTNIMKQYNKLASKNATRNSSANSIRLYIAKYLHNTTLAIDPTATDLLLDIKMKVVELITEIVPVAIDDALVIATERFLITDPGLTYEEFKEKEDLLYDTLFHSMAEAGSVSGRNEFKHLWDEASKLLQRVSWEIGGPL